MAQVQLDQIAVCPQNLRAELQASRFGFGLQISESDPRSSQSSKASAKALTLATPMLS